MTLAPALIAERQHHAGGLADARDLAAFRDRVGDRLVEEHVLAGLGRRAGGGGVDAVRRGVDDRLDFAGGENFLVARGGPAARGRREPGPLVAAKGLAGRDVFGTRAPRP